MKEILLIVIIFGWPVCCFLLVDKVFKTNKYLKKENQRLKDALDMAERIRGIKTDQSDNYINKFIYQGQIWFDITDSTVTPATLKKGCIAYDCSGKRIIGELDV